MFEVVFGASGSGKSEYAENLACALAGENERKYYIAAMMPYGSEGRKRIARHRELRRGKGFTTIEQQRNISQVLGKIENPHNSTLLIECMSNLVANEMFDEDGHSEKIFEECRTIIKKCSNIVVVTNDVFSDGCSYNDKTRAYIECLAGINRQLFNAADHVTEVVYSVPVKWK